ncbi:unnamed protein product [Rotaria socialis]|uniref:NAD(P)(+)--arginine ADP-ribosyltransferase n=1 Tax=Rotaria socialis TaxID=392032 RepID=A0A818KDP7_9BILA|nr:unnamed protein product [Rotaria socialis]
MWNASLNPFSNCEPAVWRYYDNVDNIMIEDAFRAGETHAILDEYTIDFKHQIQICNIDQNKQRPIKRLECTTKDQTMRAERFAFDLINPKRPFSGLYGWIPPFIKETVKYLKITKDQLPSKDKDIASMIVAKAAAGIIEQSKLIGKQRQGENLAERLLEKKDAGTEEIWKQCAFLYSLDSFLYRKMNEAMRLVGDDEYKEEWRQKVRLLGPFCLLLWDSPFSKTAAPRGKVFYRGADLNDDLISIFKDDCDKEVKPRRSFQSFTSCSRQKNIAKVYGNVLFIMTMKHGFTVNLKPYSKFPDEEEELIFPGVCFTIDRMKFDENAKKYYIYLSLMQQFSRTDLHELATELTKAAFPKPNAHYSNTPMIPRSTKTLYR